MFTRYPRGLKRCCSAIFRKATTPHAKIKAPLRLCFTKDPVFNNGSEHLGMQYLHYKFDFIVERNIRLAEGATIDYESVREGDGMDEYSFGDMVVWVEDIFYYDNKYYAIIRYRTF